MCFLLCLTCSKVTKRFVWFSIGNWVIPKTVETPRHHNKTPGFIATALDCAHVWVLVSCVRMECCSSILPWTAPCGTDASVHVEEVLRLYQNIHRAGVLPLSGLTRKVLSWPSFQHRYSVSCPLLWIFHNRIWSRRAAPPSKHRGARGIFSCFFFFPSPPVGAGEMPGAGCAPAAKSYGACSCSPWWKWVWVWRASSWEPWASTGYGTSRSKATLLRSGVDSV